MVSESHPRLADESGASLNSEAPNSEPSSSSGLESTESSSSGSKSTEISQREHVSIRRGPVIVSSDEEFGPEPIRPQILRAPSKTPSWAKSSVSPSPPHQDVSRSARSSKARSRTDLGLGSRSTSGKGQRGSGSATSRPSTERSSSRASPQRTKPTVSGLVASGDDSGWESVFGSESAHESDSGESGRIRSRGVRSERSWSRSRSQSVSSLPPVFGSNSSAGDDSRGESDSGEDSLKSSQSPSRHSFVSPGRSSKKKKDLKLQPPKDLTEFDLPVRLTSSPPEMSDSLSGDEKERRGMGLEDDPQEASESGKTSPRFSHSPSGLVVPSKGLRRKQHLGSQSPSQSDTEYTSSEESAFINSPPKIPSSLSGSELAGSDLEEWQSAVSGVDLDSETRSNYGSNPSSSTQAKKPKSPKFHKPKNQALKLNPDYVELLNEDIHLFAARGELIGTSAPSTYKRRRSRMIMGSVWTGDEQATFFKQLPAIGKDNLPELARRIGTKSIVECRAYLKALQDGREDDVGFPGLPQMYNLNPLVSAKDIPAAVELSDECVKALEENADFLERRTREHEERAEKAKWGDTWLLDSITAEHIEYLYRNKRIKEVHAIAPEAELLNVDQMLDLSEWYVNLTRPHVLNTCQFFHNSVLRLILNFLSASGPYGLDRSQYIHVRARTKLLETLGRRTTLNTPHRTLRYAYIGSQSHQTDHSDNLVYGHVTVAQHGRHDF